MFGENYTKNSKRRKVRSTDPCVRLKESIAARAEEFQRMLIGRAEAKSRAINPVPPDIATLRQAIGCSNRKRSPISLAPSKFGKDKP